MEEGAQAATEQAQAISAVDLATLTGGATVESGDGQVYYTCANPEEGVALVQEGGEQV